GLYVRAVAEGLDLPRIPADPALRAELEQVASRAGAGALHQRLRDLDPLAADRIDPRNVRRTIRALEVTLKSGRPFSAGSVPRPRYDVRWLGLDTYRECLYR